MQMNSERACIELKTKGDLGEIQIKIYKLVDTREQDPIDWVKNTNEAFELCEIGLET